MKTASSPPYHTLLAILVALAFRGLPRVFPIVVAFQLAIIVTTRGVGGHYFADIAAGAALALFANWFATKLVRWHMQRTGSLQPRPVLSSRLVN